MSVSELQFCVLLLLALWTYAIFHVSGKVLPSRCKNKLDRRQQALKSRDFPLRIGVDTSQADRMSHLDSGTTPLHSGKQSVPPA